MHLLEWKQPLEVDDEKQNDQVIGGCDHVGGFARFPGIERSRNLFPGQIPVMRFSVNQEKNMNELLTFQKTISKIRAKAWVNRLSCQINLMSKMEFLR